MGCGTAREKLEDEMMVYKLERMEIQMQKEKELKKLAEIEGHVIERHQIPDYIDPEFAKEKRLYADQNNIKENIEKKENKEKKENNDIKKTKKKSNKIENDKKRKKKTKN